MKKFFANFVAFLFVLSLCSFLAVPPVQAGVTRTTPDWAAAQCPGSFLLNAVALNAGATALTFYIGPTLPTCYGVRGRRVLEFNRVTLSASFDYTATPGTITLTCTGGSTQATATSYLTTCTVATGTCTLNWSGVSVTPSMSADTGWLVTMGTQNAPVIKCIASHSGAPGATDKITVVGWVYSVN
jgi:hypothetical protein